MKIRLHLALAGAILLAACGGSDELAAPTMRLVHLAPDSPRLTLYKDGDRQREADDLYYKEASNYYSTAPFDETWSVRTSSGGSTVGSVGIMKRLHIATTASLSRGLKASYCRCSTGPRASCQCLNGVCRSAQMSAPPGRCKSWLR